MEIKSEVTPEFEEHYAKLDRQATELAFAILEHVKKITRSISRKHPIKGKQKRPNLPFFQHDPLKNRRKLSSPPVDRPSAGTRSPENLFA